MALVETALPMLMSGELETLGFHDYGGKLDTAFTAHPKICPITGELHFFGYAQQPPFLTYHVVNASGELTRSIPIPVKTSSSASSCEDWDGVCPSPRRSSAQNG
jgi:carotenoid cleavage dioxygenase-like enzyme